MLFILKVVYMDYRFVEINFEAVSLYTQLQTSFVFNKLFDFIALKRLNFNTQRNDAKKRSI